MSDSLKKLQDYAENKTEELSKDGLEKGVAINELLGSIAEDYSLSFLEEEDKSSIHELGVITHANPEALNLLFNKIKFRGNPNSKVGFLSHEGDAFVGVMSYNNTLVLISNREYISPRLLMNALSVIVSITRDVHANNDPSQIYFSPFVSFNFRLAGLNTKVISHMPSFVLDKMSHQNGRYEYQGDNLKIIHDDESNVKYFKYMQKFKSEPLFGVINQLCLFNPELALPVSFVVGKKFDLSEHKDLLKTVEEFELMKRRYNREKYKVQIEEFPVIEADLESYSGAYTYGNSEPKSLRNSFVFEWVIEEDVKKKKVRIYPKYQIKDGYLLYTNKSDFCNNPLFQEYDENQKAIAQMARDIFGNYVLYKAFNRPFECFSAETMSRTALINDPDSPMQRFPDDVLKEKDVTDYYNSLSNKVLKHTKK